MSGGKLSGGNVVVNGYICTPEPKKTNETMENQTSPVEESLPAEHGRELLGHALPDLLDGGRVAHESRRHLEALGRHVTNRRLHVVRNPLHEVRRVLVDHREHLGMKTSGRFRLIFLLDTSRKKR